MLKKHCESLIVERGPQIFAGKKNPAGQSLNFDYKRYRTETELWNRYIQPILDEHKISYFKYVYQPWDDVTIKSSQTALTVTIPNHDIIKLSPIRAAQLICDNQQPNDISLEASRYLCQEYNYPFQSIIELLLQGAHKETSVPSILTQDEQIATEDLLPRFQRYMRECITSRTLPYLFKKLSEHQKDKYNFPVQSSKPDVSNLFDMSIKDAEKKFIRLYGKYNLAKYPDESDFKNVVGIKRKSMTQKMNRP